MCVPPGCAQAQYEISTRVCKYKHIDIYNLRVGINEQHATAELQLKEINNANAGMTRCVLERLDATSAVEKRTSSAMNVRTDKV